MKAQIIFPCLVLTEATTAVDFGNTRVLRALYDLLAWRWVDKQWSLADFVRTLAAVEDERQRHRIGRAVATVTGAHRLFVFRATENLDLRERHDRWYGEPHAGDYVRLGIYAVVGSSSAGTAAFRTGSWPTGVTKYVDNNGRIAGKGGVGGAGGVHPESILPGNGQAGSLALLAEAAVNFNNVDGVIAGGGGGGGGGGSEASTGGGGGGGGAGRNSGTGGAGGTEGRDPGFIGNPGQDGTLTAGGVGGEGGDFNNPGAGGDGGGPGSAGANGGSADQTGGTGGPGGPAISGLSNITWIDANGDPTADDGTILGATS